MYTPIGEDTLLSDNRYANSAKRFVSKGLIPVLLECSRCDYSVVTTENTVETLTLWCSSCKVRQDFTKRELHVMQICQNGIGCVGIENIEEGLSIGYVSNDQYYCFTHHKQGLN